MSTHELGQIGARAYISEMVILSARVAELAQIGYFRRSIQKSSLLRKVDAPLKGALIRDMASKATQIARVISIMEALPSRAILDSNI